VLAHRSHHQSEHVDFALGVMGREREDVATGVVQDTVDTDWLALAINDDGGAVTDIGMPERTGALGLPAKPNLGAPALTLPE
jgi:hypothetical protein